MVPGITAASAVTAYAGIPLTHRDYAQSVTFVTGHYKADSTPFDWSHLAQSRQTLAIYMGTMKAADISEQLIQHGRDAATPVAVISRGTRVDQHVAIGTLQDLATGERRPNARPDCGGRSGAAAQHARPVPTHNRHRRLWRFCYKFGLRNGYGPKRLTHLRQLEAESIHIIREVAAEFSNPVMMYSIGKDSSVMLHGA